MNIRSCILVKNPKLVPPGSIHVQEIDEWIIFKTKTAYERLLTSSKKVTVPKKPSKKVMVPKKSSKKVTVPKKPASTPTRFTTDSAITNYYETHARTTTETQKTRKEIYNALHKLYKIDDLSGLDDALLNRLFDEYDKRVFGGQLRRHLRDHKATITFKANARLTSTAGRCKRQGCHYTMEMAVTMYQNLNVSSTKIQLNGGISCTTKFDCFLITFEHELVHLLFLMGIFSPDDMHGPAFKRIVKNIFGHTKITHNLLIDDKIDVRPERTKADFRAGQLVEFGKKGNVRQGMIVKLNPKKAQIVMRDTKEILVVPYTFIQPITN